MRIIPSVTVPIDSIRPWADNPNKHTQKQIDELVGSYELWCQYANVVVWHGNVIKGNGFYLAAKQAGATEIEVKDYSHLSKEEAGELALQDNESARGSETDWKRAAEIVELAKKNGRQIPSIDTERAKEIIARAKMEAIKAGGEVDAETQIDKADELRQQWGTELGQVWEIPSKNANGVHRVICGDCTDKHTIERLIQDERAEVLFTSPPYYDQRTYMDCDTSLEKITQFIPACFWCANFQCVNLGIVQREHAVVRYWDDYIAIAELEGYKLLSWNVWDKLVSGGVWHQNMMFALEHEFIFVFGKHTKQLIRTVEKVTEAERDRSRRSVTTRRQKDGTFKYTPIGQMYDKKNMGTVLRQNTTRERKYSDFHSAIMRQEVAVAYIEAMADFDEIILDPFLGSGTTIMACETTGRLGRGIEIAPQYVAVSLQRFKDAGLEPRLVK